VTGELPDIAATPISRYITDDIHITMTLYDNHHVTSRARRFRPAAQLRQCSPDQTWSVPGFMDTGLGCQLTDVPIA
jgi:hypothetical protein